MYLALGCLEDQLLHRGCKGMLGNGYQTLELGRDCKERAPTSTEKCAIETLYHRSYILLYIVLQIRRKKNYLSVVWKSSDCARIVLLMNNAPCRITALLGKYANAAPPKPCGIWQWHVLLLCVQEGAGGRSSSLYITGFAAVMNYHLPSPSA